MLRRQRKGNGKATGKATELRGEIRLPSGVARLNVAATFDDYYVGLPFFGLAATVCAWLWLKSNYIPKGLAVFGVISSGWCVICAFVFLIFPHFNKIVNDYWFDSPMAVFEMALSFWLLFKGLRPPGIAEAVVFATSTTQTK